MMHQMIHWPACFDAALWPFAMVLEENTHIYSTNYLE
jgi:hypothetical protein